MNKLRIFTSDPEEFIETENSTVGLHALLAQQRVDESTKGFGTSMTCQSALDQRRGSLVQSPGCLCSKEAQSRGTLGIVNESIHKVRPQMFQHVSTICGLCR